MTDEKGQTNFVNLTKNSHVHETKRTSVRLRFKLNSQRNSASSMYINLFPKNKFIFHRACKGHPGEHWDFYGKIEVPSSTHSLRQSWAHSGHLPVDNSVTSSPPTHTMWVKRGRRDAGGSSGLQGVMGVQELEQHGFACSRSSRLLSCCVWGDRVEEGGRRAAPGKVATLSK